MTTPTTPAPKHDRTQARRLVRAVKQHTHTAHPASRGQGIGDNMYEEEKVATIICNAKRHEFVFRPGHDDPDEGATLTGVYDVLTGQRLRPSTHAESEAWVLAHEQMGI